MTDQLVVVELWALVVDEKPPGSRPDGGAAHISSDSQVTEEEPAWDQGVGGAARWAGHDVQVRGVEAKSGSWQTVGDQINPEQLHWDQSLGQTECSSQEDTHNWIRE